MNKTILVTMMALLRTTSLFAQDVELERLSKPVRKMIEKNPDIRGYEGSCLDLDNCIDFTHKDKDYTISDYKTHIKEYDLKASGEDLFTTFAEDHPNLIWNGDAKFQMIYRKVTDEVFYKDAENLRVELGDIVFLELTPKIGKISMKLPVAFKIIELNTKEGILAFTYLTNNKSKGMQQLRISNGEGSNSKTHIIHTSKYLSGSKFRDNKMYEPFHEQFTDDFYIKLDSHIEKKKKK